MYWADRGRTNEEKDDTGASKFRSYCQAKFPLNLKRWFSRIVFQPKCYVKVSTHRERTMNTEKEDLEHWAPGGRGRPSLSGMCWQDNEPRHTEHKHKTVNTALKTRYKIRHTGHWAKKTAHWTPTEPAKQKTSLTEKRPGRKSLGSNRTQRTNTV